MYHKKCRCGHATNVFKYDIGPFFIDECCTKAGYDHLGNKAAPAEETPEQAKARKKAEKEAAKAKKANNETPRS